MNPEILYIVLMASSSTLFALGGTGDWPLASKLWRRVGIPAVFLPALLALGVNQIAVYASVALLFVALCMGYGDSKGWWYRAGVMSLYSACSLPIGISVWVFITPIVCLLSFFLSRQRLSEKQFVWKMCEFIFGASIGITFVGACVNRY